MVRIAGIVCVLAGLVGIAGTSRPLKAQVLIRGYCGEDFGICFCGPENTLCDVSQMDVKCVTPGSPGEKCIVAIGACSGWVWTCYYPNCGDCYVTEEPCSRNRWLCTDYYDP